MDAARSESKRRSDIAGMDGAKQKIVQAIVTRDRIIERQTLVMRLASQVLGEISTDRVLDRLVQVAIEVLYCERVSIFLVDGDHLVCHAAHSAGEIGWRIPIGKGVIGAVAQSAKLMNLRDAYDSPELFDPSYDASTPGCRTRSILCMPMKDIDGNVVGVLQATNKCGPSEPETEHYAAFDEVDERMLELLLTLMAEHVRVCGLIDARQKAEDKAHQVRTLIQGVCAQRDLESAVDTLAQAVLTVLNCQRTLVFLRAEQNSLFCRAVAGKPAWKEKGCHFSTDFPTAQGVTVKAIDAWWNTGREQLLSEESHAEDLVNLHLWLASPITSGDCTVDVSLPKNFTDTVVSALIMPMHDGQSGDIVGMLIAINKIITLADLSDESRQQTSPRWRRNSGHKKASLTSSALGKHFSNSMEFGSFSKTDVRDAEMILSLAAQMVQLTNLYSNQQRYSRKLAAVLSLISDCRSGFQNRNMESVVKNISQYSKLMFECDRCTFFLMNELTGELVGHFVLEDAQGNYTMEQIIVPKEGIVGRVVTTGEMLNIKDAWSHPWFSKAQDCQSGYRTRTILCAPLKASNGKVIAVIQCINKVNNEWFGQEDNTMIETVSMLISDLIHRTALETSYISLGNDGDRITNDVRDLFSNYCESSYQSAFKLERRSSTHQLPSWSRVMSGGFADIKTELQDWTFDHFELLRNGPMAYMPYVTGCFDIFDLMPRFNIDDHLLEDFVRKICNRYLTTVAYHNWSHAFSVIHGLFLLLSNEGFRGLLKSEALLGIFIAALGHDAEHPGLTNAYQVATRSRLALIYNDTSVLENLHASVTSNLLWGEERSLFAEVDTATQRSVRQVIVSSILWTDMVKHQEIAIWLQSSDLGLPRLRAEQADLDVEDSLKLCQALLHTADLFHAALPWGTHIHNAQNLAREFMNQYEDEKRLGLPTLPFMGKDPEVLGALAPIQVGFVQFVVLPLWKGINFMVGEGFLEFCTENVESNAAAWQSLADGQELAKPKFRLPRGAKPTKRSSICDMILSEGA